jgi:hypothetical protein
MKIHLQRFILLFFLILLWYRHNKSDSRKNKNMKSYPGFNFIGKKARGKWLQIDKLDEEILYQTSLPAGLGSNDVGLDRGILGTTYVVKFNRVGNKILMIEPNYSYRAVSGDLAEKRAVEQSLPNQQYGDLPSQQKVMEVC